MTLDELEMEYKKNRERVKSILLFQRESRKYGFPIITTHKDRSDIEMIDHAARSLLNVAGIKIDGVLGERLGEYLQGTDSVLLRDVSQFLVNARANTDLL